MKEFIKSTLDKIGFELVNKSKVPKLHFSSDRRFHDLYGRAQEMTQMNATDNPLRRQRHYTLNHLLWNVPLDAGDVCELGCWRGLSAYQIAAHLGSLAHNPVFHIFDSFAGLSKFQSEDKTEGTAEDFEARRRQFACSLETVKENLKEFPFIRYYQGWIPERFPEVQDRKFSFVHVDVDLYQPIRDSFRFFYPRLVNGGMMVFDDYGYAQFPGAQKAIDDCRKESGDPFFLPLPSGQAFLIKGLKNLGRGQ